MIDNLTMNHTKNINELYKEKLYAIKKQLEATSPVNIINEALKCAENLRNEQSSQFKKDDFLQLTKANAIQSFLDNIKGKSITDTIAEFNKKTDEYNSSMQVILDKTQKKNNQYKAQYQSVLDENAALKEEKVILSLEYSKLERKLLDSEAEINKLQARFTLFNEFKALFDVLFDEFPNLSPNEIMEDIKTRKREGSILVSDYSNALETISVLRKQISEQSTKTRQQVESITKRTYQIEENYKEKIDGYEKTIIQLKNDLSQYKHHMDENLKIHNSLYSLYNLLIETFSLSKELKVNPELDIREEDFKVDMLNKDEIIQYIKIMIRSFHYSSSDKLLRETIAYANMMVRTFMKEKINKRFAPVEVFTDIKQLLEAKHEKNVKLKQDCSLFKDRIENVEKENKNLLSTIETLKKQVENLQSYAKRTTKQRLTMSSNLINKENILCVNKSNATSSKLPISEVNRKQKETESKYILTKSSATFKKKINRKKKTYRSIAATSTSPQRRADYSQSLAKKNMEKYVIPVYDSNDQVEERKKKSSHNIMSAHLKKDTEIIFNEVSSESSEGEEDVLNEEEVEHFKDMKTAPNRDKLLKTHGFQSFLTNLNGFKELVDHTNRIFFYKAKMHKGKPVSKLDNLNRNVQKRFIDYSSSGSNKIDYANREDKLGHHFKTRILTNINNMITSMKDSDK